MLVLIVLWCYKYSRCISWFRIESCPSGKLPCIFGLFEPRGRDGEGVDADREDRRNGREGSMGNETRGRKRRIGRMNFSVGFRLSGPSKRARNVIHRVLSRAFTESCFHIHRVLFLYSQSPACV